MKLSIRRFTFVAVIAAVLVMLMCTGPLAAPPEKVKKETADKSQPREFDFELDRVTVDILRPDATMVEVLKEKTIRSLIRIRMHFINEIVRSAEDI